MRARRDSAEEKEHDREVVRMSSNLIVARCKLGFRERRPRCFFGLRFAASTLLVSVLACGVASNNAWGETRLLRYPDLSGDRVVFTYAGDLWQAPVTGGTATRLTSHPGVELFAKYSPDGQWIAFTGQYDGDEQVYVVPVTGGEPRQLTYYPAAGPLPDRWGFDHQVYGFTPDGSSVIFRSLRDGFSLGDTRLYTVPVAGGLPEALPMPESGGGDLSPDGRKVVYSPVTRDFRHWKRYEGGWAQDLWILDRDTLAAQRVTDHPRSDRDPMWIGDTVYFASDRDDVLNLYAWSTENGELRQVTVEDRWDVRWPSADHEGRRIVYERGGQLVVLDLASGQSTAIEITVSTDALGRRARRVAVGDLVSDVALSPGGERALFAARGDLFSVPSEHGLTRNLTSSSGVREREPAWSHDGKQVAFVSDRSGEEEIWLLVLDGNVPAGEPDQLTRDGRGRYYDLAWSPTGTHIAYRNQAGEILLLEVSSRTVTRVADDPTPFTAEFSWSPHGGWLAITLADETGFSSIWLYRLSNGSMSRVTAELWNEFSPTFGPEGDYLYFLADRMFQPQLGAIEFNYALNRETVVIAVALRDDVAHPVPPRDDTVSQDADQDKNEEEDTDKSEREGDDGAGSKESGGKGDKKSSTPDKKDPITIDLDGLSERVARLPLDADNYAGLQAVPAGLLVVRTGASYYGRPNGDPPELLLFDREKREAKSVVNEIGRLALSGNGKKLLVSSGSSWAIHKVAWGAEGKSVSTAGLAMDLVPKEEWRQIYNEVWRRFRDFFYVENMHGVDWPAMQERFEPMLEHVAHRSDLNYVISEMIGELNVSHAYIVGGDREIPDRPRAALLGARFERDGDLYRIARVLPGQNEEARYRSPLTEIGVGLKRGDYVLEINGQPLSGEDNPYRLLRHAGGAPVELLVSETAKRENARRVLVDPVRNEDDLLYLAWVLERRAIVEAKSGGRLGYVHIPDMGANGIREWIKWYYGQVRKEGLVIDVRSNGGGNVSPMIIERLRRDILMLDFERHNDLVDTSPGWTFAGHLVCLIDEDTASDGDQFAYTFRRAGLGPLIGKRSWGGVVGIYGREGLIDGGGLSVPEAGSADPEGDWTIEGYGVDPDIVVENLPKDLLEGRDPQLEKGIEVLLTELQRDPRRIPGRPAPPDKSRPR